jgi:hypothetical protein
MTTKNVSSYVGSHFKLKIGRATVLCSYGFALNCYLRKIMNANHSSCFSKHECSKVRTRPKTVGSHHRFPPCLLHWIKLAFKPRERERETERQRERERERDRGKRENFRASCHALAKTWACFRPAAMGTPQ